MPVCSTHDVVLRTLWILHRFQKSFQLKSIFRTKSSFFSFIHFNSEILYATNQSELKWFERNGVYKFKERTISRTMLKLSIYLSNTMYRGHRIKIKQSNSKQRRREHTLTHSRSQNYCRINANIVCVIIRRLFAAHNKRL